MKFNWKECTLGDFITFQRGYDLPKSQMINGKYPVVGSNGIIGYHNEYTTEFPSITIGRSGNVGNPFIVYGRTWSHNTTLYVKDFKGNDPTFVFYFLKIMNLANYAGGSAVPTLNRNHIHTLPIKVPESVEAQKKIGHYLRLLDEKIELNHAINKNLQQQAQALYQQMFITNRNPNWKNGLLSDLVAVKYGKDHKKLEDGVYPVYGSGGIMRYVEKPLYTGESVLIPRKGTLNNVMYVNGTFWSVDTMFYTEMLRSNVAKFVYHFVKSKDLASMNAGSAVPSMTTNILNAMQLYIPDNETLSTFEEILSPMYSQMQENEKQSKKLAELRDTLLPRLMSGDIDVSEIEF